MTKLWIACATAVVALTFASGAKAYSTEPVFTVTNAAVTTTQTIDPGAVCMSRITPELAAALALPKSGANSNATKLACADK